MVCDVCFNFLTELKKKCNSLFFMKRVVTFTSTEAFLLHNNIHDFLIFFFFHTFVSFDAERLIFFSSFLYFGAGVMYAHIYIYIYGLFTLYFIFYYHIVTTNYVFILLYMMLYKHISYHTIPFCISLRNKCLVSFLLEFYVLQN